MLFYFFGFVFFRHICQHNKFLLNCLFMPDKTSIHTT